MQSKVCSFRRRRQSAAVPAVTVSTSAEDSSLPTASRWTGSSSTISTRRTVRVSWASSAANAWARSSRLTGFTR